MRVARDRGPGRGPSCVRPLCSETPLGGAGGSEPGLGWARPLPQLPDSLSPLDKALPSTHGVWHVKRGRARTRRELDPRCAPRGSAGGGPARSSRPSPRAPHPNRPGSASPSSVRPRCPAGSLASHSQDRPRHGAWEVGGGGGPWGPLRLTHPELGSRRAEPGHLSAQVCTGRGHSLMVPHIWSDCTLPRAVQRGRRRAPRAEPRA